MFILCKAFRPMRARAAHFWPQTQGNRNCSFYCKIFGIFQLKFTFLLHICTWRFDVHIFSCPYKGMCQKMYHKVIYFQRVSYQNFILKIHPPPPPPAPHPSPLSSRFMLILSLCLLRWGRWQRCVHHRGGRNWRRASGQRLRRNTILLPI